MDLRRQHRMLSALMLLAVVVMAGVLVYVWMDPAQQSRVPPVAAGFGFAVVMCLLTFWPGLDAPLMRRIIVGLSSVWLLVNVLSLITTHRPVTSGLLLHLVMLGLLAFAWLPYGWAVGVVVVGYGALCMGALFSAAPDVTGLLLVGLALVMTWYLSRYGDSVQFEQQRNAQLVHLASTDPLTGLCNRRAGMEKLEALSVVWRAQPRCLSVLMLDLDHFKRINDSVGHGRGDEVLVAVARVLDRHVQRGDVLARWGGEEFLIVLAGVDAAGARETALRMLQEVRALKCLECPPLSASGGLAQLSEAGSVAVLLRLADERLYAAKEAGRDRLVG
ncbi:GGDEF domain-containing protein [Deinococcus actinosclerus]|nr:GGDEF domain-containing protein [Deinococcus actinosclerus]